MENILRKFKTALIIIGVFLLILYFIFLIIVPIVATNIWNNKKAEVQKIISETSGLNFDCSNLKVITTPFLAIGFKADEMKVSMPDGNPFVSSGKSVFRLSLPSLLVKTIKISCLQVEKPEINIDIVDGSRYAIMDIFPKTETAEVTPTDNAKAVTFDFIYKIDKLVLTDYKVNINDLKTSHYLSLRGEEAILKYDGKNVSVKTEAGLYSDENKNITANIDIKSVIPEMQAAQSVSSQNAEIPFINPVEMYRNYDLKSNINAKLNISGKDKIKTVGHIDITDTTLKIGSMQLPKSYLQLKFDGQKMNIDSNLYLTESENARVKGLVDYSEKPSTDLSVKTNKVYLASLLNIAQAFMDSFHIQNSLESMKTEGYIIADAKIKTDYKKLSSSGKIELAQGSIQDKKSGLKITDIKSLLSFDNNMLKISDTQAYVNGTPFIVEGTIQQDSVTDIKIYTRNMPLAKLYASFAPADLKKSYLVNGGILSLNIDLKGKLQELAPIIKTEIVNLDIKDKINNILITNGVCLVNLSTDLKTFKGDIKNSNLIISSPGMSLTIRNKDALVNFDDKNILIKPTDFVVNGESKFTINGDVKNYVKAPVINVTGDGSVLASVVKTLAGKDIAPYLSAKGEIPVKMYLSGDAKKQNVVVRLYGSPNGYVTPIDFIEATGKNSAIQINADISDNKITFKDSGFYVNSSSDIKQPIGGKQLIALTGAVGLDKNMTLHSVKITTVNPQRMSIYAFDKSKLSANANIIVTGSAAAPKINGNISVSDVSVPQLLTKISKADLNLNGNTFGYNISELNLNGSVLNINGSGLLDYKPIITLYGVNVVSDFLDADKVMKVSEEMTKVPALSPVPASPSTKKSQTNVQEIMPVKITSGSIDIKKIKSGDINASNITSKLTLSNNVVYLNDLKASAFDGNLNGQVSMDIMTSAVKLKVTGSGMNADKTVTACAAMKNTISGTLGFNADLSLRGATYEEQMKTLKGKADFTITNGQFGSLGRFETFLKADNLASIAFISTATGSLINKISPHNTAEFANLNGVVSFNGGNMNISPITSTGKNMSLYITGNMNLLNNNANMLVLGRISNEITSLLGPLNQLNPVNILKTKNSTWAAVTLNILDTLNQAATPSEMNKIPKLTPAQENATTSKFIVKINGNIEKPQSAIKSFRWLSSQSELNEAEKVINPVTTVKDVINTLPKTKEETVNTLKEAGKNALKNFGKQLFAPPSEE